jgi:error-prone DNA polymerase
VFAAALLNSQPMGFYAPAQIVRDTRDHGVQIRPLDVNRSAWDCTLEPEPGSQEGLALRLGLRMAAGLARQAGEQVVKARRAGNGSPFASVEEVVRRANLGRKATEALAAADGFAGLGIDRRRAIWAARGVEQEVPPLLLLAAQSAAAGEPPLLPEAEPVLPREQEGQRVVLDYLATGLTLGQHPLALLRPQLKVLGCQDTREIDALPSGKRILLAGLVLMRQRPGTSKGVVFVTVEDEHGTANLVVFAKFVDRDRAALINARLLIVTGKVERETEQAEVPVTHIIAEALIDRTDLLRELNTAAPQDWGAAALGRADEGRRPESGSRRPVLELRSRHFQ